MLGGVPFGEGWLGYSPGDITPTPRVVAGASPFVFGWPTLAGAWDNLRIPERPVALPQPALLHPLMAQTISTHFPSRCTIQLTSSGLSASGQIQPAVGIEVLPGHVNIPARIAPLSAMRPRDEERRTTGVTSLDQLRAVKLQGYYPSIVPRQMRAVVDEVVYEIIGIEHDSQSFLTRLIVEWQTPRRVV